MNCQNCGTLNNIGSKFCIKCGKSLNEGQPIQSMPGSSYQEVLNEPINKTLNQNSSQNFDTISQPMNNLSNTSTSGAKVSFMSYFFIILAVILKPFTAFKEELNKFNGFKNSIILSLIISVGATLINLISSMLSVVRVKSFDWASGGYKTNWIWENLKNLDYLKIIGKNFLIYLGIIVAIAVVYYLGSLIIKKQTNFSRLLGISALAIIPLLICSLILAPLLSLIWVGLKIPVIIIGVVYTVIIIYEVINNEILLEGNVKYYFNLVCLSILGIVAYYLCIKVFMSSITGELDGLNNIMNMFG